MVGIQCESRMNEEQLLIFYETHTVHRVELSNHNDLRL